MKSPLLLVAVLAAALPLLYGSPALAAATTSASLSHLRLGTLDLTPDDGIAAGYDIGEASALLQAVFGTAAELSTQEISPEPNQPASVRIDHGSSFGEARTSGMLGDLSTDATAYANARDFVIAGVSEQLVWLTLRPNTVLTVSGHLTTAAAGIDDDFAYNPYSEVSVMVADENLHVATFLHRYSYTQLDEIIAPGLDEDFLLTYGNGSDQDLLVYLYVHTQSEILALAPVPEPGTWAMLCAGLLTMGAAARSRRRRG